MSRAANQLHQSTPALSPEAIAAGWRQALTTEIDGLVALRDQPSGDLVKCVDLLLNCVSRVIVSGIGKSGHIARKIASTLASTGTPALFVHPAEASHGDLGMITKDDVVIAISNSGEAAELADLIGYTRRYRIPLIALTAAADSTLGRAADYVLLVPKSPEACPLGLAPTTSTTQMLAAGDALAVILLEQRGFSRDQYKVMHPGGKLGQRLRQVQDVMSKAPHIPLIQPHQTMKEVIMEMASKNRGGVGVVDENQRLIGMITDGDLKRHLKENWQELTAASMMNPKPTTIAGDLLVDEALAIMTEKKITILFVVKDLIPIGLIHIHDILNQPSNPSAAAASAR